MEKREKRDSQRERSMGGGETRISDSKGLRREKVKGREKAYHEREKSPKNYVFHGYRRR